MRYAVETIGGCARPRPRAEPRLPMVLLVEIALQCADLAALPLKFALVCREWHAAIFARVLLPRVVLRGERQLRDFCGGLERDTAGITRISMRSLRTVTILQESAGDMGLPALFDAVASTRRFGNDIDKLLLLLLSRCLAIKHVYLHCEPRALDARRKDVDTRVLRGIRSRIESLACLSSPWAGDMTDALWDCSNAPWTSLTHLQLHGPRLRFTMRAAHAIAQLPSLTHFTLVAPKFAADTETDAAMPLQLLVQHARELRELVVVGHCISGYIGEARRLRPAINSLVRVVSEEAVPELMITFVTVWRTTGMDQASESHGRSTMASDWLFSRLMRGIGWSFDEGYSIDGDMVFLAERWPLTTLIGTQPEQTDAPDAVADDSSESIDVQYASTTPRGTSPVWGIDNLD